MRRKVLDHSTESDVLEEIYQENKEGHHAHRIIVGLSLHPKCPDTIREQLFQNLFWRDLMKAVESPHVPERAKHKATQLLIKRLSRITLGEWKTFARQCIPSLFPLVMKREDCGLFTTLLDNPRLTETKLIQLIHSPDMQQEFCVKIVDHDIWKRRRGVCKSIIYCQNGDLTSQLLCLKKMTSADLHEISRCTSLHPLIRQSAEVLIHERSEK